MDRINPLLRRATVYPDESLAGYLLRLTEKNYYDSPTWIFDLASLSHYNFNANLLDPSKNSLSLLSQLTGVEQNILWELALPISSKDSIGVHIKAFGRLIPLYAVHKSTAKVCPDCLTESQYCRKIWDLSIVTACPIHSCLLIDKCPNCKKPITWLRSSITRCKNCDFDWREYSSSRLEQSEIALPWQLHKACKLPVTGGIVDQVLGRDHPITALQLEHLISITFFLAGQLVNTCDTTGRFIGTSRTNVELHSILSEAFLLFQNWPQNFYQFLDWRRSVDSARQQDTGILRDFGSFYKKLYTNFPRETYCFLHEAFETYLAEQWDGGYLNTKLSRIKEIDSSKKAFISAAEAAKILETTEKWVVQLIEQEKLTGSVRKMGKRKLVLVKAESLELLKVAFSQALTLKDAAKLLGVNHRTVVDLVKHSCLEALRGPGKDGHTQWLISPESVSTLLERLSSQVELNQPSGKSVSFFTALRKLSGLAYTTGRLVRLILDGAVRPCEEVEELGLKRYRFLESALDSLIKQSIEAQKEEFLTVLDVARLLEVKQEVAAFWIDKGLIPCEKKIGPERSKRRVSNTSLRLFEENYISAAKLSKILKTSPKKVVQKLMSKNINPITGPQIDGGRQYLFLRSDTIAVL